MLHSDYNKKHSHSKGKATECRNALEWAWRGVEALYIDHHSWLQRWLHGKLGNRWDAADVAHDTFIRALQKLGRNDEIHEPRSFLVTIARGLTIDLWRRRALEAAYLEVLATVPEAHQLSLETQAIVKEALFEVDRMLDGLGPQVRGVFLLSQLEGLTYPQIAVRMGISPRTVSIHLAKAIAHCCLTVT